MTVLSSAHTWWAHNVTGTERDYGASSAASKALKGGAIGAGSGALVGAGAGAANKLMDEPFVDWVTKQVPKPELGPLPTDIFGPDTDRLMELVRGHSAGAESAEKSLQYLAYLQDRSPLPVDGLSGVYRAIEDNFGNDVQVRSTLNLMSAFVEKYPDADPNLALREFLNHSQYETDYDRATQTFMAAHKLSEQDLQETLISMEHRHTTALGKYSLAQASLMGAGIGMAAGAGVGAAVGVLTHVIKS